MTRGGGQDSFIQADAHVGKDENLRKEGVIGMLFVSKMIVVYSIDMAELSSHELGLLLELAVLRMKRSASQITGISKQNVDLLVPLVFLENIACNKYVYD